MKTPSLFRGSQPDYVSMKVARMLVRYWMTENVYVATEGMTLLDCLQVMKEKSVRRLPVVEGGELRGIVCLSDLYQFVDPTLLDGDIPDDLAQRLESVLVGQQMTPWPISCEPNDPLEEVGARMRKQKIGAMPVLRERELVGIVTESDIFEALTQLAGWGDAGQRICMQAERDEKLGLFRSIVELCDRYDMELVTLLTHPLKDSASDIVMLRVQGQREEEFVSALWREYRVLLVE